MATDVGVGDVEVPRLDVTPADETTAAALVVTDPDGVQTTPAVTKGTVADATVRFTADAVTYDKPRLWRLLWTVTGTGVGEEPQEVFVVPVPGVGGPLWRPGRSRVAAYIPGRTLVPTPGGANIPERTFDSSTNPPGVVVDRLIADAIAWILAATGPLDTSLHELGSAAAAVFAAAMVEQGYPDRDAATKTTSADTAAALLAQARTMRDDLARANAAANGSNPTDPNSGLLPVYAFPALVPWGDSLL